MILNVVGARPNFMKIGPVVKAMRLAGLPQLLVHSGQHYEEKMSELFFQQLGIPTPDLNLEVGSGSQAAQTAEVMRRFEPVMEERRPELVVVVGDVNSTLACALVAAKLGIRVAHIEAGLRSFDRSMPEEINRVLTDAISDLLFVSERSGLVNLKREGIADEKVHFVGNVMIDTLLEHRDLARQSNIRERLGIKPGTPYALVTLHRPSNVDQPEKLAGLFNALGELARELPIVFPMHPRTRKSAVAAGLAPQLGHFLATEPLGYLEFLHLMDNARLVITDSGGVQEETTALGVPCLTVRENTERPVTVEFGTNRLVGSDPLALLRAARDALNGMRGRYRLPELWDGRAATRIIEVITKARQS